MISFEFANRDWNHRLTASGLLKYNNQKGLLNVGVSLVVTWMFTKICCFIACSWSSIDNKLNWIANESLPTCSEEQQRHFVRLYMPHQSFFFFSDFRSPTLILRYSTKTKIFRRQLPHLQFFCAALERKMIQFTFAAYASSFSVYIFNCFSLRWQPNTTKFWWNVQKCQANSFYYWYFLYHAQSPMNLNSNLKSRYSRNVKTVDCGKIAWLRRNGLKFSGKLLWS